jgi:hypothetical protein
MHDHLVAIWMMLSFPMKKKSNEELDLYSSFSKNFILTLDQCCLIDWLIIMRVCSISEDSKEARPHYGVPHTTEVLYANTESHGLCSLRVRCERGRRVLSFLAEKNSRPKHEIRYTRLVPTKITNYSRAEWLWTIHRIIIISGSASISSDEYSRTGAIPPPAAATPSTSQQQWWRLQLHQGSKGSKGCQPHGLQHCELHIQQRVSGGGI